MPPCPPAAYPPLRDPSVVASQPFRVIVHVDMDAFYCQVERERFPHFRHRPLAVVQGGSLCVSTSYEVRARGLPKMGAPHEMRALCPSMVFCGSDMVRYRAASRVWLRCFEAFSPHITVMKRSIDECYIDVTQEVRHRIQQGHLMVPVPHTSPDTLTANQQCRSQLAEQQWRADEAKLREQLGAIECHLLESSGSIEAAIRASRSTDPITQLREQQESQAQSQSQSNRSRIRTRYDPNQPSMSVDEKFATMPDAEIEAVCRSVHPIDFVRAQREQDQPIMLAESASDNASIAAFRGLKFARGGWIGNVFNAEPPLALDIAQSTVPSVISEDDSEDDNEDDGEEAKEIEKEVDWIDETGHGNDDGRIPIAARVTPPSTVAAPPSTTSTTATAIASTVITTATTPPPLDFFLEDPTNPTPDYMLCIGSQIAFELRSKLFEQTGFTTSAGIAPNPMLAKLASSQLKPNQQSVIRPVIAPAFLAPIKLAKINGFGPKAQSRAAALGFVTVGDVQSVPYEKLVALGGEKFGHWLSMIGMGLDETVVKPMGPPLSIGQSKHQPTINESQRFELLHWLASKLYDRLLEDEREYHRMPTALVLSWVDSNQWRIVSKRAPLTYLHARKDPVQSLYDSALSIMKAVQFNDRPLKSLSLTATNFLPLPAASRSIENYFRHTCANSDVSTSGDDRVMTVSGSTSATPSPGPTASSPSPTTRTAVARSRAVRNSIVGMFAKQQRQPPTQKQADASFATTIVPVPPPPPSPLHLLAVDSSPKDSSAAHFNALDDAAIDDLFDSQTNATNWLTVPEQQHPPSPQLPIEASRALQERIRSAERAKRQSCAEASVLAHKPPARFGSLDHFVTIRAFSNVSDDDDDEEVQILSCTSPARKRLSAPVLAQSKPKAKPRRAEVPAFFATNNSTSK